MQKWEYASLRQKRSWWRNKLIANWVFQTASTVRQREGDWLSVFNLLGSEGWELAVAEPDYILQRGADVHIFKREI